MGYNSNQIGEYWETLANHLQQIPQNNIKMWCTDNNGQISNNSKSQSKVVGNWTLSNTTEKGNGEHLIKICEEK